MEIYGSQTGTVDSIDSAKIALVVLHACQVAEIAHDMGNTSLAAASREILFELLAMSVQDMDPSP